MNKIASHSRFGRTFLGNPGVIVAGVLLVGLGLGASTPALAVDAPIKVVSELVDVPPELGPEAALDAVEDVARIFELYEPLIPWVPGINLDIGKEIVSSQPPFLLDLPVDGVAIGRHIDERAHVLASTRRVSCPLGVEGREIVLDFSGSSYNVSRRINRIEITACPITAVDGAHKIAAEGRMYAGPLPQDPRLNALNEAIGAKALQTAFIRQVSPVLDAVERRWAELGTAEAR